MGAQPAPGKVYSMGIDGFYDKHEAAKYLGISESALSYHIYTSGRFPEGRIIRRWRVWTKAELDSFKEQNIVSGWHYDPANPTKAPGQFTESELTAGRITYKGERVMRITKANLSRWYSLHLESGDVVSVWNNTQLSIEEPHVKPD